MFAKDKKVIGISLREGGEVNDFGFSISLAVIYSELGPAQSQFVAKLSPKPKDKPQLG